MRIGLVCKHYCADRGGLENYTLNLSRELVHRGHEVHVFCNTGDGQPAVHMHHVPMFPFTSPGKNLSFSLNASRISAGLGLDAVQSMERIWSQDIFRASDGINPVQMKQRYSNPLNRRLKALMPRRQILTLLEKRILERNGARHIVTNSKMVKDQIRRYYKVADDRIHVIYNGVDTTRFHPGVRDRFRNSIRAKYGLAPEQQLILFAGNGYRQKGLPALLKALARIDGQMFRLLVVGSAQGRHCLRLAQQLGIAESIIFLGYRKRLEQLYGAADLMILPTRYDPFANVCLEAMACGTPVVTTKMNGVCEIYKHGHSGYVLDRGTDDEIAACLQNFMAVSNKPEMRQNASTTAAQFSMERHMEELLALYARICEEKRR